MNRRKPGPKQLPELAAFLPAVATLDAGRRAEMLEAGREILECQRVLARGGLNVVGEVLRAQGPFVEMSHFPEDDVFDPDSHAQYYYHAHRGPVEHGHFHTFMRAAGMPSGSRPFDWPNAVESWPAGDEAISHLIAISMDAWGDAIGLFATNRWVTDETWYPAETVIAMLDGFEIDHAFPSWPTNRWLGAMLRLYRPWIAGLLRHRDAVINAWIEHGPGHDVFEDRALEITGFLSIDPDTLLEELGLTTGPTTNR